MYRFKDLSIVQKSMVMIYKLGYEVPLLEQTFKEGAKNCKKKALQKKYMELQKDTIGDEEQRRRYWIKRIALDKD